jgi:uncharacterized peroxidase-related enzyme
MHDYRRADLDDRTRALCDFAVLLTREPSATSADHVEELRKHGWSDVAIHDAIQVISFFNYINRVADGVGVDREPEWGDRQSAR